jgi:hexosaminidase
LREDESYWLKVKPSGIEIKAPTDLGAKHAFETLLQLVEMDPEGYFIPAVEITDSPRFPWRGLMMDVSRHFMPVDVVKRNIDAMSVVKFNVLHLHLSDDQGFRVQSKTYPRLHQFGSNGEYYTHEQIKEIIAYAAVRGIRVVPEFDMPGHTTAWMVGHPELASAPGPYEIEKYFGVFNPTMDPSKESTYRFLGKFFREMARLFPDEYIHIGGDENNGKQWDSNAQIRAFMQKKGIKDNHELQAYFNKRLLKILEKNKKKMMGWDEILQPSLPKSIVIHSWRGRKYMDDAARLGYSSVLSNGYYIDLSHNANKHYLIDPLPDTTSLTIEEQKRILGGEAPMWAELVTPENVDSRIWPRAAAIAERLWSTAPASDYNGLYIKLFAVSSHLEQAGSLHLANREPMMRRLANSSTIEALMLLANAAEPIEGYRRHGSQKYSIHHPLSRFVDITLPDAPDAIRFRMLLNNYLESRNNELYAELNSMLVIWEQNHQKIGNDIWKNVSIKEAERLSINLSLLASTTNFLLKMYHNSIAINANDVNNFSGIIVSLSKPIAEMELPLSEDAKLILALMLERGLVE